MSVPSTRELGWLLCITEPAPANTLFEAKQVASYGLWAPSKEQLSAKLLHLQLIEQLRQLASEAGQERGHFRPRYENFYVSYDHLEREWQVRSIHTREQPGAIYFPTEASAARVIEELGDELWRLLG